MTFEEALTKLDELDVEFTLSRNKWAYGDKKKDWTCSIGADGGGKHVDAFGWGASASIACVEAVTRFFEVQSGGIPLPVIKRAVAGNKTVALSEPA